MPIQQPFPTEGTHVSFNNPTSKTASKQHCIQNSRMTKEQYLFTEERKDEPTCCRYLLQDSLNIFLSEASVINSMAPRWKWKGAKAKALAEPMSKSISELQLSLDKTKPTGILSRCNVLVAVEPEQVDLLERCCFGKINLVSDKDKKWIQLTFEEAFYLLYSLKCIKISLQGRVLENEVDIWLYMKSKRPNFPLFFKAYSHLRSKNWVVISGLSYGVDFVAYRHHPSLVHSEYAVLVQSGEPDRLRVWSDNYCTVRLSGSVAKKLLTLYVIDTIKGKDLNLPVCLENYTVKEQTIRKWIPELSREDVTTKSKPYVTN